METTKHIFIAIIFLLGCLGAGFLIGMIVISMVKMIRRRSHSKNSRKSKSKEFFSEYKSRILMDTKVPNMKYGDMLEKIEILRITIGELIHNEDVSKARISSLEHELSLCANKKKDNVCKPNKKITGKTNK